MSKHDDILDRPILSLSESDLVRFRDMTIGTAIIGSPDAGKTSTSGKQLAHGLLRTPKSGALILTAKAEETQNWIGYAKACGREKDLIVFNADSGHCFDPLYYEWTRPGRGAGDLESIIDFFSTLVSIGKKEGHGHDPFWERGNEQLMRNCIKVLDLAGERISIANIDRVIKSLPTRPEEHEEATWQEQSYCASLIRAIKARKDTLTAEQWSDLDFATQFIFRKWPAFDERPRSSLEMTWSGMADKFLFNPFNRLFCGGKCTFTPEMTTHEGKIVICDFPMLEYGHETGRLINVILKLIFQRAWLRRKLSESPNPVFLWQDEFQYFVTRRDNFFQQTCRGSRVAVVCLTQNILNLAEELGEQHPGSKTKSFLGNLSGLKIFHQQNEIETCTYAADQIGKEYRFLDSYHAGGADAAHSHASVGGSQQLVHLIEPIEFSRLMKPDSTNPHAEAIVYLSGKPFNATKTKSNPKGRNYLRVLFSREV
jgi:TraM recognition site of TraD and TraG